MKQYLTECVRFPVVIIAVALATVTLLAPQPLMGQTASEKVRLMADTLRARDSGNLEEAKVKAEELIKIAPEDENVQRMLASINRELDSRSGNSSTSGPSVFGQAPSVPVEAAMEMDASASASGVDAVIANASAEQASRIQAAESAINEAIQLADLGAYTEANSLLDSADASLNLNTATADTIAGIEKAKADLILMQAKQLAESGDNKAAEVLVEDYLAAGGNPRVAKSLARELDSKISDPYQLDIEEISPKFSAQSKVIRDLLTRGRAQYLNGDYDGAQATFKEVEARDANNAEAKLFQTRIASILGEIHKKNYYKTRTQMMTEVDQSWERPKVFAVTGTGPDIEIDAGLQEKLNSIIIPQVNFSGMELTRVIETLSELSAVYDPEQKGLNIVPIFNPNENNPRVNISLRNLNLDRILQFVTQQVNFSYDVTADAVTIQPSDNIDRQQSTVTEFFPITRATVIRLTGVRGGGGSSTQTIDPFSAPSSSSSSPSGNEETEALQTFFQSAGVNFELPGTSLAFDGEQLIVTQTRRNLERMRTILRNYNEVKQVEIEAKFLEVAQNDLEEVGFDWMVTNGKNTRVFDFNGTSLRDQYSVDAATSAINISRPESVIFDDFGSVVSSIDALNTSVDVSPPSLPETIDLGSAAGNIFSATGWGVNGYNVDFAIRALSRKSGSDLMSAPKVTVLSGKQATITVAQELRYPESYGDIESQVGSSNSNNNNNNNSSNGGSSISITAGTPQDFVTRNVGVELSVTPNVENDDTISLRLEPRVTEFEGFVEYGGPSVALSGDTTVTVPAGFYQPIFSTREMSTEVTVFDGATLVMGGLTRDEVKSVNDKVPVLGDIPGLGRLFRSEGETRQKRNLLIFVTANLVSPGGSPARQSYRNVDANSLFQNPTIMTPSGAANRSIDPDYSE